MSQHAGYDGTKFLDGNSKMDILLKQIKMSQKLYNFSKMYTEKAISLACLI